MSNRVQLGVLMLMLVPLLASSSMPMIVGEATAQSEPLEPNFTPNDLWSDEYVAWEFPWGGDERVQFKQYHDYFTMRDRMMELAEENPDIMSFHEGLIGGENHPKRGQTTDSTWYEGHFYKHSTPWMKITGGGEQLRGVHGGECNDFVGDCGNYEDIPDIQLVGNHHAREWMSYEVPMFFLETLAFYYGKAGIDNDGDSVFMQSDGFDNDGDGLIDESDEGIDEDPWGDANNDGQLDDDGDCLILNETYQDSNGDGIKCGPGDLGVDEDFSEQLITDLVNTREIYLIPMLNVDGNRYDREVYCGETAWENCKTSGWRKNLRQNIPDPLPFNPTVDESCDGVDLNRNYQYEWGWPLGATAPVVPGSCSGVAGQWASDGPNNDVYTGPYDTRNDDKASGQNEADELLNEDPVDGADNDGDGIKDEDWQGGNSEPETKFIQDMTEMNDDDGDGKSDFKAALSWHSFSNLVLYPWGHCTNCETEHHNQLVYHGDVMAEMTEYENMQSSSLYPTTGDYCDWHYGVYRTYCYTIEIGGNSDGFHPEPEKIDHIAVRNLGIPFYMVEISDDPTERADMGIANVSGTQWLIGSEDLVIPDSGPIPITMCIDPFFPLTTNEEYSHVMWRMVKPSKQQSDYGPREWVNEEWKMTGFEKMGTNCTLNNNATGDLIVANLPVPEDFNGKLHYKSMLGTRSGTFPFSYPAPGQYEEVKVIYRAPFGNSVQAFMLFGVIAAAVWGGLAVCLKMMVDDQDKIIAELDATSEIIDAEEV